MTTRILYMAWLSIHLSIAEIFLPCEDGEFVKQEGCTCWNPQAPIIFCTSLGLTSIPEITDAHTINLEGNNLTHIPARGFSSLTNLKRLILANNGIRNIDYGAFADSLQVLDLHGNKLTNVPNLFNMNVTMNLTHLDLSRNFIRGILANAFRSLKALQHLHLEKNQISYISPDGWMGPVNLRKLVIGPGGMDITTIPTQNLQSLTTLAISSGGRPYDLNYISPWLKSFPAIQHFSMTGMALQDDDLSMGKLPSSWRIQLRSLYLNDNRLTKVPWNLFVFPNLQELDLSNNFITGFSGSMSPIPPNLKQLNISNNRIRFLYAPLLLKLRYAESIDVSNNRLTRVRDINVEKVDQNWQRQLVLYIGNNPWACYCYSDTAWIKKLINRQVTTRNGHLTMEEINHSIRCGEWGKHDGQLIRDVPLSVFECE